MVSISIMALLTTVVVTRQSSFNGAVLLRNQAYEVAFTLRQAQMLAVSGGDESTRRYGVFFDTSTPTQHTYTLFGDTNNNGTFDAGEQLGLVGKLDRRFEIRALSLPDVSSLHTTMGITFLRPNFDGYFCVNSSGCTTLGAYTNGVASVHVARTDVTTNGTGDVRRVEVTRTGQIAVVTY
jgi:type II secretory pathway pseudopilin PulG